MPTLTLRAGNRREGPNRLTRRNPVECVSVARPRGGARRLEPAPVSVVPAAPIAPVAPWTSWDDTTWIARVRRGDQDAARALVERLYPTVMKCVRSHLPRRTQEEDLAQAVYAKVFSKLDQFSSLVPLEHWVARIAINTCINQLKHEAVRPELRMADLSEEEEAVVHHLARTDENLPGEQSSAARELLEKLLIHLKPEERIIITLLHLEERSTEEISRLTGWSVSWVKVRAFRARNKMRGLWKTVLKGQKE